MLQEDSLADGQEQAVELHARQDAKPLHPYQVLSRLPQNATPAQQDSAIQAAFHPKEITYSTCPDTLQIPGYGVGKSAGDISLPQYYRESFFSSDTLLHKEVDAGRYGVAGDPVPYSLKNDNFITATLLVCFIVSLVSFANNHRFFVHQAKRFFRRPRAEDKDDTYTSNEVRFLLFLAGQGALLLALFQYFYTRQNISDTFILPSHYLLIAIFFGMWAGCFVVRSLLYTIVNGVFFGLRRNKVWLRSLLFITATEGAVLLPVELTQVYFGLSPESAYVCAVTILLMAKTLVFYKSYSIFFRLSGGFLQIFLYFCALEAIPLAALWSALVLVGNYLKINF